MSCRYVGVAALTCEATRASTAPFDAVNFDVRPHRGQIACAERLRLMLEGSKSANSNKVSCRILYRSVAETEIRSDEVRCKIW